MLSCRDVSEMATDYLERDLSLGQRAGFRLHLMMCKHCRRYVDQLSKTIALLKGSVAASHHAPSADLMEAYRKAIPTRGGPDAR